MTLVPVVSVRSEVATSLNDSDHHTGDADPPPLAEPRQRATIGISEGLGFKPRGVDNFLPSEILSTPPQPLTSIDIKPPAGSYTPGAQYLVTLTLLIDETGRVLDVIPDADNDIPQEYLLSAIEAFAKVLFSPGMQDQRPVRTRMQVEVNFNSLRAEGSSGDPSPHDEAPRDDPADDTKPPV
ncbi:hypothetical protein ACVNIS_19350 [Sphaerotilaceae bacterium SBD11-9]